MEGSEFLEYLELQGNLEMVTKSELLEQVRRGGGHISDRQLTSYASEGLIPKSARIGSRSGAYPAIVVNLILWIDTYRRRGLSVDAIKELIPVWKFLKRAFDSDERFDMNEFEYVARQFIHTQEAAYAVPELVLDSAPACPRCLAKVKFVTKDGREIDTETETFVPISFVIAEQEDDGSAKVIARTRFALPLGQVHDEMAIVLGVPNGVEVQLGRTDHVEMSTGPSSAEVKPE